jgi:glycerol-1-phosphate dehydrogenase [NAD(P)+]
MTNTTTQIEASFGAARKLFNAPAASIAIATRKAWESFQEHVQWRPGEVHLISNMDEESVLLLDKSLPMCDQIVGIGGGAAMDMAKYLAWTRQCRLILVPAIVSCDAMLTNTVAVRVNGIVRYFGNKFPDEVLVDYGLIQKAPKELNRAGVCDIASIHTALHDWRLARDQIGEKYSEEIASEALKCLTKLDANADEIYNVSPKGIDTIVDLSSAEVDFCTRFGCSRPEEGSEHIVAYNMEYLTGRHIIHGELVGLGIFMMSRLQGNGEDWILDIMKRTGLRYQCLEATPEEIRQCLLTLKNYGKMAKLFYSVLDSRPITEEFVDEALKALYS